MNEKIAQGKVQVAKSKAEREAENVVQIGGGKKNKGRKKKQAVEYEETFQIDFGIIKKFGMLGIAAPVSADEIDNCLKLVEEKQQWFNDNGGAKLQEQIDELERMCDEEEKEYQDEAPAQDEPASRGRGRGNRGGYRGGRGGATRGRGRGGLSTFKVRSEFDGDSDEEFVYSAPAKAPKAKQKASDLNMDEENYPAL